MVITYYCSACEDVGCSKCDVPDVNDDHNAAIKLLEHDNPELDAICNLCGLSCVIGHDDPAGGPHGLIGAKVSGGYESTAGNGCGALDDGEVYTFSLCEFCLDWLFARFVKPVDVHDYGGAKAPAWRPAAERVAADEWRARGRKCFLAEAERRASGRAVLTSKRGAPGQGGDT